MSVFLLFAVLAIGAYFYLGSEKISGLVLPIPKVFGINNGKKPLNVWFPDQEGLEKDSTDLLISAKSALVVDFDTSEVVFAKKPNERLPAASTVKIMTALLALEKAKLSDEFEVSEDAAKIGEDSMFLNPGEKLSLEELLYGMMLVSGNDAATVIAENVSGSEEKFVGEMNNKAKALGLMHTLFINPTGLDEDGVRQYSTAYDLAVIAHFLWSEHTEIQEIVSTYHKVIEATDRHKAFDLYNDTNLLTTYPGVRGIKPGFTWDAGLCLVTYAQNGGKRLIAVILGSENRRMEMKELLDYAFGKYGIKVEHPALDY